MQQVEVDKMFKMVSHAQKYSKNNNSITIYKEVF